MSIINDLTGIINIMSDVKDNRVANFAYKDAAYDNDQANGTSTYNPANNNNIPSASADTLNTNPTVLSEGLRSQASVLTRMLVNHFFGRVSYNLNKTVDKLTEALADIKNALGAAEGIAQLDAGGKIPDTSLSDTVKTAFSGISQGNDSVTVSRLSGQNAATFPVMSGAGANSTGKPGLVPKPASGDNTKFLRGDGTWAATPYPGSVSESSEGLMPALDNDTEKFLRGDGTWAKPEQSTYTLPPATAYTLGGVKVGTNLSIDNSGVLSAQDTTYTAASDSSDGLLKQLPQLSQSEFYLRGDNTWQQTENIASVLSAKKLTSQGDAPDTDSADMMFYGSDTHVLSQDTQTVMLTQWRLMTFGGVEILCMSLINDEIMSHSGTWTLTFVPGSSSTFMHRCYSLGTPVVRGAPSGFSPVSVAWVGSNLTLTMSANSSIAAAEAPFTILCMMTHDANAITSAGYIS